MRWMRKEQEEQVMMRGKGVEEAGEQKGRPYGGGGVRRQ